MITQPDARIAPVHPALASTPDPSRRRHLGTVARLLLVTALFGLGPGVTRDAWSQAASDFVAYPRTLTDPGTFRTNRRQLTFNRMPGLSPDYRLGPGDEIEVTIVGLDPLDLKVSTTGEITIPLAGTIAVGGLTGEEIESKIASVLTAQKLVKDPQVLVYVSKYESKTIYALGEVDRPGEYSVSFQISLMDLILIAGGIDFSAGRYGYLHRRAEGQPSTWRPTYSEADLAMLKNQPDVATPGTEVVQVDLQALKEGGVLERNIILRDGDVLYIPRRKIEFAYVIGDVNRPGAFELPNLQRVTIAQAVAWAGGPTKTAKMSGGMLVRVDSTGQRREFPVDFAAVIRGRQPDLEVQPNDIIFIPGSTGKYVGLGMLNQIPNLVTYLLIF